MEVTPHNNWLLVKRIQQEEDKMTILLPEGYKKQEEPFVLVEILKGYDSITSGQVIVPTHMLREANINGTTLLFVEKNHIIAQVK